MVDFHSISIINVIFIWLISPRRDEFENHFRWETTGYFNFKSSFSSISSLQHTSKIWLWLKMLKNNCRTIRNVLLFSFFELQTKNRFLPFSSFLGLFFLLSTKLIWKDHTLETVGVTDHACQSWYLVGFETMIIYRSLLLWILHTIDSRYHDL